MKASRYVPMSTYSASLATASTFFDPESPSVGLSCSCIIFIITPCHSLSRASRSISCLGTFCSSRSFTRCKNKPMCVTLTSAFQDLYLAEPILVHDVHVEAMDSAPINTPSSVAGTPTKAAPKKRAPKANQDGTPKKSTSRKKKATASAEDTALNGEQGESVGDNVKPTPKKRATPSKSAKAKVVKKEAVSNLLITDDQSDLGHGFQESLSQSEETLDLIEALDVHMTTPTPTSGAKRGARSFNGDDDTPTKKPKIKDDGVAPQLDAALIAKLPEDDQLMFQMRQQNKAWGAIEAALTSKTGKAYAPSTLRKRHARLLNDVFEWKQVDVSHLAFTIAIANRYIDQEHVHCSHPGFG